MHILLYYVEEYINTTAWHLLQVTSDQAGHQPGHTLLSDGVPFFNQHLLQVISCDCVGHSGTNSMAKLITNVQ